MSQINLDNIVVDVALKNIKHVHLSVHPPTGRVRISAPKRMSIETIRTFAISKLDWIKQKQLKIQEQERETPRNDVDDAWCKNQMQEAVPLLLARWQRVMNVRVERFSLQWMKTRWGSCNYNKHTIHFNTALAKKPAECLEYVVVHELVHLLEPTHNARFRALMDQFMPQWKSHRQTLNSQGTLPRLPIPTGHSL